MNELSPNPSLKPATAALVAEIRKKVRERGVVLWIDAESQYTQFVDGMGRGCASERSS